MEGDFDRDPFELRPEFSRVLMQQGRVLLPSDWNAQVAVSVNQVRSLATDIFGRSVAISPDAFRIAAAGGGRDVTIGPGRYYVDGIAVENFPFNGDQPRPWKEQPFFSTDKVPTEGVLFYLEVWERHFSAVEDDALREIALGGPDTTSRAMVIWQVKTIPLPGAKPDKTAAFKVLETAHAHDGRLRARAKFDDEASEPCTISPHAQFRGTENQLYRVEIHRADAEEMKPATLKWSRDNGSVAFPIAELNGDTATLGSIGWDERTSLAEGQLVEVVDDDTIQQGELQELLLVKAVDRPSMTVTFTKSIANARGTDPTRHPILRRWDGVENLILGGPGTEAGWIKLENGVEVRFESVSGDGFRTGDFWLIPARTISDDVIWPKEADGKKPAAIPPHGPQRHYAPLAWWKVNVVNLEPDDLRFVLKRDALFFP